ncbi:MAG: hypothetical protein JXQ96_20055, partial [Cyclobacteriaceae bacterium]
PQLSIAVTANNTDCNTGPATPNGILTVTVDNAGSLGGNYNYTWYNGADVNDEGSPTGDAAAGTAATSHATTSGLAAGDYWVKVEDVDAATCIAKISASIINDQAEISVDEFTAVASTECTPGNGTVTIDQITVDGVTTSSPADMANYTFELYDNTDTYIKDFETQASAPSTLPQATTLAGGTYYIKAVQNAGTACSSPGKQITIDNDFTLPTLSIAEMPNTA